MVTKHYCNGKEVATYEGSKSIEVITSEIKTVNTLVIDKVTSNEIKYHDNNGNTFIIVVNN